MLNQVVQFFSSISFFSTVAFGIIAMVIVGSSWCLVGLVMGDAPKKGIDSSLVQLWGAVVATVASVIIMFATADYSTASWQVTFYVSLILAISAALNFTMLELMSRAMQCGPNGVIWSIIQSAMVFPFIVGMIFFDVEFTWLRGAGIFLLLAALVLFAITKDNSSSGGKWKMLAIAGLIITAIQQNLSVLPSYYPEADKVPSIVRVIATELGFMISAIVWNLIRMNREHWEKIKSNLKNGMLWKYTIALQFFNLFFSYTLHYPGMNVMADKGMGGMCYPMMVGSCIVSFTLSSIWLLKEKVKPVQLAALIVCIGGLILICTK
ncbi:MAG: hypothetical protein IJW23_06055 [Lentisphaeria bacterium]|nr:hypothetical protein [Lentisphaeria bacterium]